LDVGYLIIMIFEYKLFSALSPDELYDILQLRAEIFVVEQDCVYNDIDGLDKDAIHQFHRKNGELVAYSRLLQPGTRFPDFSIGRVVVKQSERGTGLGIKMMEEAKYYLLEELGATKIKISAQKYLQKFYEDLGFKVVTKDYLEDDIPHVGMLFSVCP
jgi:ElaA protein